MKHVISCFRLDGACSLCTIIIVTRALFLQTPELNSWAHHALSPPRISPKLTRSCLGSEEYRDFLFFRDGRSYATPGMTLPGCTKLNSVDAINISKESRQYWYASCRGIELWMPSEYSMSRKIMRAYTMVIGSSLSSNVNRAGRNLQLWVARQYTQHRVAQ
jgi:hypothetical protein